MACLKLSLMILGLLTITPLWYFVMYSLLKASNVSDFVWFAFWIYVPLSWVYALAVAVVDTIAKECDE